jgi:hypothetical protein
MLDMALNSGKLFFKGRLFKDNREVVLRFALGVVLGLATGVGAGQVAPLWLAAIVAGGVSGAAQPILLRNVKYA